MAKKYITDKLSAKTASSGITYEGDAVFNGGPDGTFSFDFNNGTTNEFSVNFQGDDFLTVNGGTGVFEVGDIAGLFDGYYLKVDGSSNLLSWKYGQDNQVTFDANSTVSLYGTGTNNASGAELHILKGQSNEVSGKLKLNSTTQYLDLEYEDPGATNIFRLYRDYSYTSQPIRIGADAATNELDDYEEGTWTPQIYNSSGYSITYVTQQGKYVKIGRQVFFKLYIKFNALNYFATNGIIYANLPFASVDTSPAGIADFFPVDNNFTPFGSSANNQHTYKIKCWLAGQTWSSQYKFLLPPTAPTAGMSTAAAAAGNLMASSPQGSFYITGSFYTTV